MTNSDASKVILALDVPSIGEAERLLHQLEGSLKIVKVGSASFYRWGMEIIHLLKKKNLGIFVDFKFHDIPNTVGAAVESLTSWGIEMLTVHLSGGKKMLEEAVRSAKEQAQKLHIPKPMILGISVLTSIDETTLKNDLKIQTPLSSVVSNLANLAKESGLDGIVASGHEIETIRKAVGNDLKIVCPGIRTSDDNKADQKRTLSAEEAFAKGADFVVVGRPIYQSNDPRKSFEQILQEISHAD